MSSPHTNLPTWPVWIFVGSLLGLTLLCADRLPAGSVFMKNGYIIQGPVVDRDDDSVILGWDNGKVRIFHRFIESISFEAGEESRLEENARARIEEQRAVEEILAETREVHEDEEDLPADVNVLLEMYGRSTLLGDGSDGPSTVPEDVEPVDERDLADVPELPDSTDGTDGATLTVDVQVLEPPPGSRHLAAAIPHPSGGFSWHPPRGWELRERAGMTEVRGPAGEDGSQASINVVGLPRGGASWDATIDTLKEQNRQLLENFGGARRGRANPWRECRRLRDHRRGDPRRDDPSGSSVARTRQGRGRGLALLRVLDRRTGRCPVRADRGQPPKLRPRVESTAARCSAEDRLQSAGTCSASLAAVPREEVGRTTPLWRRRVA